MNIINFFNKQIKKLNIPEIEKLKQQNYKTIKDLVYAGYEQLKNIETLTPEELENIVDRLKHYSSFIDLKDKNWCQTLIKEYEEQIKNTSSLDTQIRNMKLSVRLYNCLARTIENHNTILELLYHDKDIIKNTRNMGTKTANEFKEKLLEYGINYDNRQEIIKKYKEECFKDGIVKQLEKTIEEMLIEIVKKHKYVFDKSEIDLLEKQKEIYNTILDFIINREQINPNLKRIFLYFGINLENNTECQELLIKYYEEKNNAKEKSDEITTSNEKLNEITTSNEQLEKTIEEKTKILREIKFQLERRKELEQQIKDCDDEYKRLIEQYERRNDHGTK